MEKEVTTKVETNNSLMRKTKAQLVDIILRKDDVEKELKKTLKEKDEHESALSTMYKDNCGALNKAIKEKDKFEKLYNELRHDFHKECDDHVIEVQTFKNKLNKKQFQLFCLVIYGLAITCLYLFC